MVWKPGWKTRQIPRESNCRLIYEIGCWLVGFFFSSFFTSSSSIIQVGITSEGHPVPKAGLTLNPEQVAHGFIQLCLKNIQVRKFTTTNGQRVPLLSYTDNKNVFLVQHWP